MEIYTYQGYFLSFLNISLGNGPNNEYSSNRYSLSTYCVPCTVLGTIDRELKTDKNLYRHGASYSGEDRL